MKKLTHILSLLLALFQFTVLGQSSKSPNLSTANLRTEYKTNPIGMGEMQPRLNWELLSNHKDVMQSAYHIRVAASGADLKSGKKLLWDSGKITSDQSNQVVYGGQPLKPRQRCYWQVRVWDNKGNNSGWSELAFWEMGLLLPNEWSATWISPNWEEDSTHSQPSPMLRKSFRLNGEIKSARLYATSHGLYRAEINGKKVGDELFTPGWTSYHKRLQYQTFDVTQFLQNGENAIGVLLGDGWWRGNLGWGGNRNTYGSKLALLMQLEITYKNGKTQRIMTDGSWKAETGPIIESDIYNGEIYNAQFEKPNWTKPSFDDHDWRPVKTASLDKANLVEPIGPPVKKIQEIKPIKIIHTPADETVFDFGQNMVGWVRLKVKGNAGTTIKLQHAEVLDKAGNFYIENMRAALTRLQYTLKGTGEETYEPHFTFMGFRYVKVEGFPGELTLDNLTGIVIHSDLEKSGGFECSNPLVNQLQSNIQWGQKGNFLDVPTDCPQRDERLGWTGDAQAFSRTANFNYDCAAFYTKWLADVALDQGDNGNVPFVVPNCIKPFDPRSKMAGGSTGWADVATILPWNTYLAFGDKRLLERQYESMKAWVAFMEKEAGDDHVWDTGFHFGDWLFYSVNNDNSGVSAITDKYFLTQAFFAHSTDLVRRAAEVLGKKEDLAYYTELLKKVKTAFNHEHVTPSGRLSSSTQTAYVIALQFDLLPENLRQQAANRLVENIRRYDNHITTGFLGTPYINHVLSRFGHPDVAYELLMQESYPSWLYPVKMGATTIWERWDGIKPDSTFEEASMNSFNHYAYGAIGDWLYRTVAGIDIDEQQPGYKHIIIKPQPGGKLTYAKAWHESPCGKIESGWKLDNKLLNVTLTIPANTSATLILPKAKVEGIKELKTGNGIHRFSQKGEDVEIELGSGTYSFQYPMG